MTVKSIYEAICQNLTPDGKLPEDFRLPFKEESVNQVRFMPGAKDGIFIFHYGINQSEEEGDKIVKLLKSDWKQGSRESQSEIAKLLNEKGTLFVIDAILDSIRNDHEDIDINSMFNYAYELAFESTDEELVKLGIGLLGLLDFSKEEEIINKLLTLALYDEFTLYVVVAVSSYANSNDILFKIAQKVEGWGKIHTVERLEPTTEEIRQWILRKGCSNMIIDAYLGLECANKGDLLNALHSYLMDDELYEGISVIIDALIDEGPVSGISVYEEAEKALHRYLLITTEREITMVQLWRICNLQSWLENCNISNKDELQKLCNNIVGRQSWNEKIIEILNNPEHKQFFHATNVASKLNMDVSHLIYKAIKENPIKNSGYLHIAYKNPEYAKDLTEIYEEILPLDNMAQGMGDLVFADNLSHEFNCLELVLQELRNYPKTGQELVATALKSPLIRARNGACKVLEEWCNKLNENLQIISPRLYSVVKEVEIIEINADTKENMKRFLKI